jgi:hypothetical protein
MMSSVSWGVQGCGLTNALATIQEKMMESTD